MLVQNMSAASPLRQARAHSADLTLLTCKLTPSGALSRSRLTMSRKRILALLKPLLHELAHQVARHQNLQACRQMSLL